MSQRAEETKALAFSAFWAILAEGKPPTVDLIMERLVADGHERRNRNQIAEQLKACWAEVGRKTVADRTIPGLPSETIDLVVALRDNLLGVCKKEFAEDVERNRIELQKAVSDADSRVAEAESRAAIERNAAHALEERLALLQSELSTSNENSLRLQEALANSRVAAEAAQQRCTALTEERDKLIARFDAAESRYKQAMQREDDRYKELQRSTMQQLDDERTRSGKLARQIESLEGRLQSGRDELSAAMRTHSMEQAHLSAELGEARGRVEMLQLQAERLQADADARARENSDLSARFQVLRAHSENIERQLSVATSRKRKQKESKL